MSKERRMVFPRRIDVVIVLLSIALGFLLYGLVVLDVSPLVLCAGGVLYGVLVGVVEKASPELRTIAEIHKESNQTIKFFGSLNYFIFIFILILMPYSIMSIIYKGASENWKIFVGASAVILLIQLTSTFLLSDSAKKWTRGE